MQTILAIFIGIIALIYVALKFFRQFYKYETNPKCGKCPVMELKNSLKQF